jgi:hypothetical protein
MVSGNSHVESDSDSLDRDTVHASFEPMEGLVVRSKASVISSDLTYTYCGSLLTTCGYRRRGYLAVTTCRVAGWVSDT